MFKDIDNIIKSSGVISLDETMNDIRAYLSNYNIRFTEKDIEKIFITYQRYSAYRYSYTLEEFIKKLVQNERDVYIINNNMKKKIKNIQNESSFTDYKLKIIEGLMDYLNKLNKFNSSFIDNYFIIKKQISILVKENYNMFLKICYKKLYQIKFVESSY